MGWKLTALIFLFALWALNVGALIVGIPILLYLGYRFWSSRQNRLKGAGRPHWMIYFGVFLIFLSLVAVAERGTYSPIVFGVSGVTLLTLALFPGISQEFVEKIVGPASELFQEMSGRERGKTKPVPYVELTKVPLRYLDPKKNEPEETLLKFERLSQTLAELGHPVETRLEFSEGAGRILFCAPEKDTPELTQGLLRLVRSQLPEFGPEIVELAARDDLYTVFVEGVPQVSVNPVDPLAKFFIENRLDGSYSVGISPAWVNPMSRWLAGRRQRKIAESSGYQRVDDNRTTTVVDHPKQIEFEESVKGLERLLARRPVRVSVQISADDELTASHAANLLAGVLSSQQRINGLKVGRPRGTRRSGWHRSTLMLPSEAAPYLWLPHSSVGIEVIPSAEFQAPPLTEGEVVLGEAVRLSGKNGQQVRVPLDQLAKHVFVTGMTGSGKTTSCFDLLLQLNREGIPFLVIEPVKSEYRSLLRATPDLQVFTVGDEGVAPFRLNVFEPPPGVRVQHHLENLVAVWNASFVTYSPIQYVIPRIFAETYRVCGWDLVSDRRGQPISFEDVREQARKVVRGLGYEPKATMDIEAAIKVRLDGLMTGSKGRLFGAVASTPMKALMERPTVVELKDIQNDEEKAFVAALILMNLAGYVQARGHSQHLEHFTLIEEAHRLLPNVSTEKGDPEAADPRRAMVEQFGNMLAELRAFGEGLAVVEQIPTKILPDAIKNTATKIVHRVATLDDRRVIAGAMNATKEQAAVLTTLRPGQAVLSIEGHPVPAHIEVEDAPAKLGLSVGTTTDEDVKMRIAELYPSHPVPRDESERMEERMKDLVDSEAFRGGFLGAYRAWYKRGEGRTLASFLLSASQTFAQNRAGTVEMATKLLSLGCAFYLPFDAEQRAKFPRLFRKELEAALQIG